MKKESTIKFLLYLSLLFATDITADENTFFGGDNQLTQQVSYCIQSDYENDSNDLDNLTTEPPFNASENTQVLSPGRSNIATLHAYRDPYSIRAPPPPHQTISC